MAAANCANLILFCGNARAGQKTPPAMAYTMINVSVADGSYPPEKDKSQAFSDRYPG